jgi:hypothetical protein
LTRWTTSTSRHVPNDSAWQASTWWNTDLFWPGLGAARRLRRVCGLFPLLVIRGAQISRRL